MALHIVTERLPHGEAFVRVQPYCGNYARLTPEQARERATAMIEAAAEAEAAPPTPQGEARARLTEDALRAVR
jgi:hypothetical protein